MTALWEGNRCWALSAFCRNARRKAARILSRRLWPFVRRGRHEHHGFIWSIADDVLHACQTTAPNPATSSPDDGYRLLDASLKPTRAASGRSGTGRGPASRMPPGPRSTVQPGSPFMNRSPFTSCIFCARPNPETRGPTSMAYLDEFPNVREGHRALSSPPRRARPARRDIIGFTR